MPSLRIKGLTDREFYAQPGLSKERDITMKDFADIFGSQIAEGEISSDWATKYKGIFTPAPRAEDTLKNEAISKKYNRTQSNQSVLQSMWITKNPVQAPKKSKPKMLAIVSQIGCSTVNQPQIDLKKAAGINSIELSISGETPEEFVDTLESIISDSYGGILLQNVNDPQAVMELLKQSDVNIPVMTRFEHGQSIYLLGRFISQLEKGQQSIKGLKIVIDGSENHESVSLKQLLESYGADNVSISHERDTSDIFINVSDITASEKYMTVFPQIVRAVLETESTSVTQSMKIAAAEKFATVIKDLPETQNMGYKMKGELTDAIAKSAIESGVAQKQIKTDF